jgi:hypothetical protein
MLKSRYALSTSLLLLAACVTNANVGGPRSNEDSGAPEPDGAPPKTSPSPDAAPADAASPLDQAFAYASGDVPCTAASDCCVVFDDCTNQGLVVGAASESKVVSLLSAFDQSVENDPNEHVCTGCIPPPIQVSCVQNKCVGTIVDTTPIDGTAPNLGNLEQNHCGSTPNAPLSSTTGSILGC